MIKTSIGLIILHYKNKGQTENCLKSIQTANHNNIDLSVYVVINNPGENLDDLKAQFSDYRFLQTGSNLGYSGGNNFGIKQALNDKPEYLIILNNDTTIDKRFFNLFYQATSELKNKKWGIIAPKIYFAPGYEFHKSRYQHNDLGHVIWYAGGKIDWDNVYASHIGVDAIDSRNYDTSIDTEFATGCCMCIKSEVIHKVGLFSPDYFLYLEDLEFSQRVKNAGYAIVFVPSLKIWHFNAASSAVGGSLHDYFITRNRLLFGLEYAPFRAKFALLRESLKLLINGRPWQKTAVTDYYLNKLGKGSWHD